VYIELEQGSIQAMGARKDDTEPRQFMQSLVDRGLQARLEMQSLVTGQLIGW